MTSRARRVDAVVSLEGVLQTIPDVDRLRVSQGLVEVQRRLVAGGRSRYATVAVIKPSELNCISLVAADCAGSLSALPGTRGAGVRHRNPKVTGFKGSYI
jgi:hypothetical protein